MPIESNIKVNFDYIMNPYTITTTVSGLSTTNCAGSVNLSSDNFSTCGASCSCVGMTPPNEPSTPSGSRQNIDYTLNPTDNLSSSTSYKVKVTTDAKDVLANPFASDYIHSHELKSSAILPASDSEVFFAVGQSGKIFRSGDNGASWDNETCFTFEQLNGVSYGSNTFVAVGNDGRIERSTDNGVTWSTTSSDASPTNDYYGIAFGQSKFIAVGENGYLRRSNDNGASWYNYRGPYYDHSSSRYRDLNGVAFGNNTFVAVGVSSKIITSTNPTHLSNSWTSRCNGYNSCFSSGTNNLNGVAFGNGTFVAVGASGSILSSDDNGTTWDTTNSSGSTLNGVAFGNSTFVVVGDSGRIMTSTDDGSSWTSRTSGTSNTLKGVTFGE